LNSDVNDTFDCELLRPIEFICQPDPRSPLTNSNPIFGTTLETHHQRISAINLNNSVPRDILIQFETAKNLHLYAWYVYRFYPVAEYQALTCLELALRTRFEKEIPKKHKNWLPTLSKFLDFAIRTNAINNEGFSEWHRRTLAKASSRYKHQKSQEMNENELDRIELNEDEIEVCDEDKEHDYMHPLKDWLRHYRNAHAHGSSMLNDQALGTIRIVSEIINQIYPSQINMSAI